MIEFVCKGCLSVHTVNPAFANMRARCVVCGVALRIPTASQNVAQEQARPALPSRSVRPARSHPTLSPANRHPRVAAAPAPEPAEDEYLDLEGPSSEESVPEEFVAEEPEQAKPTRPAPRPFPVGLEEAAEAMGTFEVVEGEERGKKKKKRKGKGKAADAPESAIDREMRRAMDTEIEKVDEEFGDEEESEKPPLTPEQRKKRNQKLAIGSVVAALVIVGGYLAFSGEKKKEVVALPPREPPPPVVKPPEPPPEPPKIIVPKKVEPTEIGLAPAPRPIIRDPQPFAASRMLSERGEAPQVFDQNYTGVALRIFGTCGSIAEGVIKLADSENGAGITCVLREGITPPPLQPGQAVAIAGMYDGELRMTYCEVVRVSAPADEEFKDKDVEISGIVAQGVQIVGTERFPTLVLEQPLTDTLISIRCLFRLSEQENLAKLRPGQPVTVRGKCEGRTFRVVRLHDCTIVPPEEAVLVGPVRAKAERFFAAYEADLLPVPRPDSKAIPIPATAEQLAIEFAADLQKANTRYRYKVVEVTGKVIGRGGNTIILETGTAHQYQVVVALMPLRFAALREEKVMTLRGTCVGVRNGAVRLENGDRYDADAANPAVRTVAEYFPLQTGRELYLDALSIEKPKDNPITQYHITFAAADTIRVVPARIGVYPGATLFGDLSQPKWLRDFTKPDPKAKVPLQPPQPRVTRYRVKDGTVELLDVPPPPAQPTNWWDPVFKIGFKSGESWSSEMPDGQTVTYTVVGFSKDKQQRQCVDLTRVVKPSMDPPVWEESRITYAVGVGEIRRVVTRHSNKGQVITVLEMRLAEAAPEPKQPEKK